MPENASPNDDPASSSDGAELSSLGTVLDDLAQRVTAMAERRSGGGEPDEAVSSLFNAERALREARRHIEKATSTLFP